MESTLDSVTIRAARHEDIATVLGLWGEARSEAAVTPDSEETVAQLIEHTPDALLQGEDTAFALWRSVGYEFDERIARFVRNL